MTTLLLLGIFLLLLFSNGRGCFSFIILMLLLGSLL